MYLPSFYRLFAIAAVVFLGIFSQISYAKGISILSVSPVEEETSSPWGLGVSMSLGFGIFQDIQVPLNNIAGSRGDGTTARDENKSHSGLPVVAAASLSYRVNDVIYDTAVEYLDMQAASGPADTQSSSYNRVSLSSGLAVDNEVFGIKTVLGSRVIAQRTSFNNVTSGHYINALLLRGSFGVVAEDSWQATAFYSMAPYAQFGYKNGSKREKFNASSTRMSMFGVDSSLNIHETTWFDMGFNVETAQIKIQDVKEYDSYGLNVTPTSQPSRLYNMSTMVLKAGFHKTF